MADLLSALDHEHPPRSPEVAQRVAVRVHSNGKVALCALLWLIVVANNASMAALFASMGLMRLAGPNLQATRLGMLIKLGAFALGHLVAWLAFARWVRSWRTAARELGRDGEMVDAITEDCVTVRGGRWYTVRFELDGHPHTTRAALSGVYPAGYPVKVLARPGFRYLLVFDKPERDRSCIARLRRAR